MVKRKDKRNARKPLASHDNDTISGTGQSLLGKDTGSTTEREVERQIAAIKAKSDMEIEHLLTRLRLVRTFFNEEQLKIPALQFFKESLPNVSVVRNGGDANFDLQWKDEIGNFSMYTADGRDIHASLLHRMSLAYPSCLESRQSLGGYQFSAKSVKTDFVGADDLQMGNYFPQEPFNSLMLGLPTGLQTPGVDSQRLSVGMTPKTLRLPKQGEMLLSVHGSPLGVYKEDNMEAIRESEED